MACYSNREILATAACRLDKAANLLVPEQLTDASFLASFYDVSVSGGVAGFTGSSALRDCSELSGLLWGLCYNRASAVRV